MERVNSILKNDKYKKQLNFIEMFELDRAFCRHNIAHFMDVARIAYILVLENHIDVDKELVYAAALLHDIGRGMQYKDGISHETAALDLAEEILDETGFNKYEVNIILNAIKHHRNEKEQLDNFDEIFSKSDKLSRNCYNCKAAAECNWNDEKKNININY